MSSSWQTDREPGDLPADCHSMSRITSSSLDSAEVMSVDLNPDPYLNGCVYRKSLSLRICYESRPCFVPMCNLKHYGRKRGSKVIWTNGAGFRQSWRYCNGLGGKLTVRGLRSQISVWIISKISGQMRRTYSRPMRNPVAVH